MSGVEVTYREQAAEDIDVIGVDEGDGIGRRRRREGGGVGGDKGCRRRIDLIPARRLENATLSNCGVA